MNDNKIKLIVLFGPSAGGKDTLLNYLVQTYPNIFHKVISYTTRQKRDYEHEGIDYYFIDNSTFTQKVLNGDIIEATSWDGEFYGSGISAMDNKKINIAVLDEHGIECLLEDNRIKLTSIFIYAEDKIRLLRALNRESKPNCEKICRRLLEDHERFDKDLNFDFYTYYNQQNLSFETFFLFLKDHQILTKID